MTVCLNFFCCLIEILNVFCSGLYVLGSGANLIEQIVFTQCLFNNISYTEK